MSAISRSFAVSCTLLGCVGCDQASKSAARMYLEADTPQSFNVADMAILCGAMLLMLRPRARAL